MADVADYAKLEKAGTNGANFDLSTEDIIARLKAWDERYGITIGDVESDAVTVTFHTLPDDTHALAREIYDFCPDTVDQHWGCVAEMLEWAEESGEPVPEDITALIEGVDLEDEDYGLELLRRNLVATRTCGLWWD